MNTRSTAILAGVAVVVLALGLYFGVANREPQTEAPAGQLAFPDLTAKLPNAAAIDVAQQGKTLHIARKGDAWTLPDKSGYPAKATHVHELLTGLAELKLAEPRTSNPDEYSRLGVQDLPKQPPKEKQAADAEPGPTLVRVLDASSKPIAQLLLGHTRIGSAGSGDGVYVRRPGEAQAWLAQGHVTAETDPMDWIDKSITNIAADKIDAVTVTRGGQTLSFARKGGKLTLQSPTEHPKLDQFKLDDVGRALDSLELDDVKPAPAPGTPVGQAVFSTSDGMTVTASVNKEGSDIWVEFSASGHDKGKLPAEALAAKLKGWAYKLGSWKEAAFVPAMDDLKVYQPPPPATKPPAPEAVPPAPAATKAEPAPATSKPEPATTTKAAPAPTTKAASAPPAAGAAPAAAPASAPPAPAAPTTK